MHAAGDSNEILVQKSWSFISFIDPAYLRMLIVLTACQSKTVEGSNPNFSNQPRSE